MKVVVQESKRRARRLKLSAKYYNKRFKDSVVLGYWQRML